MEGRQGPADGPEGPGLASGVRGRRGPSQGKAAGASRRPGPVSGRRSRQGSEAGPLFLPAQAVLSGRGFSRRLRLAAGDAVRCRGGDPLPSAVSFSRRPPDPVSLQQLPTVGTLFLRRARASIRRASPHLRLRTTRAPRWLSLRAPRRPPPSGFPGPTYPAKHAFRTYPRKHSRPHPPGWLPALRTQGALGRPSSLSSVLSENSLHLVHGPWEGPRVGGPSTPGTMIALLLLANSS